MPKLMAKFIDFNFQKCLRSTEFICLYSVLKYVSDECFPYLKYFQKTLLGYSGTNVCVL